MAHNNFGNSPVERNDEYYIRLGKQKDAHLKVNARVKSGLIVKPTKCPICGSKKRISGHHYKGYDYPYDVWWICHRCNMLLPFHDGVLNFEQADAYVTNRIMYKTMIDSLNGDMAINALLFMGDNYIDLNLAGLIDKNDSQRVADALLDFENRKATSVTIIGANGGFSYPTELVFNQCRIGDEDKEIGNMIESGECDATSIICIYYTANATKVKAYRRDIFDVIDSYKRDVRLSKLIGEPFLPVPRRQKSLTR